MPIDGIPSTPDTIDFYMEEETKSKGSVIVSVDHKKRFWSYGDVQKEVEITDNMLTTANMTAGTWKGSLNFVVNILTFDGTYPLAHEGELANWNYMLNESTCTVTLNYYTGNETDVIVYGNYPVGEKVYKTLLKSNTGYDERDTPYMFNGYAQNNCKNIQSIEFSNIIDKSNVTNMAYMFYNCDSLTTLDMSCFNTSNVTDMRYMFRDCSNLTSLDVSNFNTSNATNMDYMFVRCSSLTSLDLSNFNTSNVTSMHSMFHTCESLISLDLSNFDTHNVTDMVELVRGCRALTNIDLSSFDTRNVTNMYSMFALCESLTSLDLSNFDTHNVTDMAGIFYNCSKLKTIYATSDKWYTSLAETAINHLGAKGTHNMFYNCGTSSVTYK